MARPLRLEFEGAVYHVFSRGNDRRPIFTDDRDYRTFLSCLNEVRIRFSLDVQSYCLMPNHVHLLVHTPDGHLSRSMKWLLGVYTQRFNLRHGRVGHLFQGRYKSSLVERDSYLLEVSRYIHLNPVRADLCRLPEDYLWSSMQPILDGQMRADLVLEHFSGRADYHRFVLDGVRVDREILAEVKCGAFLGSDDFVERMKRQAGPNPAGDLSHRRVLTALPEDRVTAAVAGRSRDVAIYALWRWGKHLQRDIGMRYGLSAAGVSIALKRMESRIRANDSLRQEIDRLEKDLLIVEN